MNKIFEKFEIYDFMGIWGPGAITVTYFLFTLESFLTEVANLLNISYNYISEGYQLICLYTAVAYTVGVLLHEIGKLLYAHIALFDFENIRYFDSNLIKKKTIFPFKRIRYEYNRTINYVKKNNVLLKDLLIDPEKPLSFEVARTEVKYHKDFSTKRLDVYHSIYALARSLSVAFAIHFICLLLSVPEYFSNVSIVIMVMDIILVYLFLCRTYRYFLSWIKNTYLQYFICIWE